MDDPIGLLTRAIDEVAADKAAAARHEESHQVAM